MSHYDYYVNGGGAVGEMGEGNDANPGTYAQPFATVAHAMAVSLAAVTASDTATVYVADGTYAEDTGNGVWAWNYPFAGDCVVKGLSGDNEAVVLTGAGDAVYGQWNVVVRSSTDVPQHITVEDLTFGCYSGTGYAFCLGINIWAAYTADTNPHDLAFRRVRLIGGDHSASSCGFRYLVWKENGPDPAIARNFEFDRCYIANQASAAINSGRTPAFYMSVRENSNAQWVADMRVHHCQIVSAGDDDNPGQGAVIDGVDGLTFDYNEVTTTGAGGGTGASFGQQGTVGGTGTHLTATIERNQFSIAANHGVLLGHNAAGTSSTCRENRITAAGHALLFHYANRSVAHHNRIESVGGAGLETVLFKGAIGCTLRNNTVISDGNIAVGNSDSGGADHACEDLIIANNAMIAALSTTPLLEIDANKDDGNTVCDHNAYRQSGTTLADILAIWSGLGYAAGNDAHSAARVDLDLHGVPMPGGSCDAGTGTDDQGGAIGEIDLLGRARLGQPHIGAISPMRRRAGDRLRPLSRLAGEVAR